MGSRFEKQTTEENSFSAEETFSMDWASRLEELKKEIDFAQKVNGFVNKTRKKRVILPKPKEPAVIEQHPIQEIPHGFKNFLQNFGDESQFCGISNFEVLGFKISNFHQIPNFTKITKFYPKNS